MANASWMNDMSSQIGTLPLRSVVMPGTHDSGSYGITATSAFSADVTKYPWLSYLLNLHLASWIVGPIAAGWAKAQDIAVGSQLAAGIRYLDLRLNPYISVGDLYIVHSKYSVPVTQVLSDVSTFLQQNPNEIVILDFNHLYDMGDSDHAKMMGYLESYLGPFLLPNTFTPQSTLNSIWAQSGRVIVMYDDKTQVQQSSYLWSQDRISSPWPNTTDSAELFEKLDSTLATAPPDKLFVLQGVLTPDGSTVAAGMVGSPSSLQQMAQTVTPQVISWLRQQVGRGVNIVIADWFEYFL